MKHTSLKRKRNSHTVGAVRYRLDSSSGIERRLTSILTDLARILVLSGYGIKGFNRLARQAYFRAALSLGDEPGRKTSNARIAALTGLTRSEVSQLGRHGNKSPVHAPVPSNRAQQVSIGWISDPAYCEKNGNPRILAYAGRRDSFAQLVKDYSGDIPARAMLSEMLRLGMARQESGQVRLLRVDSSISRHTKTKLRAIAPWTNFLSHDACDETDELNANAVRITLNFDSLPQLFAAVRELQSRAMAFVEGVQELGGSKKRKKVYKLHVSIALGTRVPRQKIEIGKDLEMRRTP